MLDNEKNSAEIEQDNLNLSETKQDSLNSEIVHDSKKLKDRITDLLKGDVEFSKMKQGDKVLVVGTASGLFAAVLPFLAVGATLAIPGAIVGLTLFFAAKVAVNAVQSGYKGLKWSAEKTVEGAKYIGGKIKDGYENSVDSLKRGTSKTLDRSGSLLKNSAHSSDYSIKSESVQNLLAQQGIKDVINSTIEITKENNSSVPFAIKSTIRLKLSSKIKELEGKHAVDAVDKDLNLVVKNDLKKQIKMLDQLDQVLKKNILDTKELKLVTEIFSKCQSEIKEAIREYKFDQSVKHNNTKDAKERKISRSFSLPSSSALGRKNSEQSSSLSESSSMNSLSTTSSEAELLNSEKHKEVNAPTSFFGKMFSSSKGSRKQEDVVCTGYRSLSENEMTSAKMGNSTSYVASPKPPRSNSIEGPFEPKEIIIDRSPRSNSMDSPSTDNTATVFSDCRSSDSGFVSPNSSPRCGILTEKDGKLKTQANLKKTGSLEKLMSPSSAITDKADVEQLTPKIKKSK